MKRGAVRPGLKGTIGLALGWAGGCLVVGCGSAGPPSSDAATERRTPNILIVVLDACRPDRLGCYGYERETSPAIDELSRDPDAVLFGRHYVQGAFTKSSTASLFTGLYVFQHGVVKGHVMRESPDRPRFFPSQILSDDFDTMPERLQRLGYGTFGVVKSHHLYAKYGFGQGFDDYYSPQQVGGELARVEKTIQLLGRTREPFFGYLHLAACHHPFPSGLRHRGFMEKYGFDYDEQARQEAGVDFTSAAIMHAIANGDVGLEPDDVRFLDLIYDAQLRVVDEYLVAPLVGALKAMDLYDDTLIVVTADHGEELYDHDGYAHGHALWDEIIRVPMIVKFPRGRKPTDLQRRVDAPTQAVDVLPSLLALADGAADEDLPGENIFSGDFLGTAYSETESEWALVRGDDKLIGGGDSTYLFNLASDPTERSNRAETESGRVAAMRAAAEALRGGVALGPQSAPVVETQLSPESVKALRSLGYIR
ncbi:MAG: sulfatase [Planctomycetota bacterium]|jgi:arylsulfatase A-like enzyme